MHLYTTRDYGQQTNGPTGRISRVYGVLSIGFLVLVLACLNYINLVTSQSDVRSREVGLRKVSGALRRHLVTQFLGESVVLSGIAFVFALNLAYLVLPHVSDILGVELSLAGVDPLLLLSVPLALIPIVGILAGAYPALVLSGHEPIASLTGRGTGRSSGSRLRRTLVVLQFSASTALIITTIVLNDQIVYIQNKDLGFERDRIVALPFFTEEQSLWTQQAAIRTEIENLPNVESASVANKIYGGTFRSAYVDGSPAEKHKFLWTAIDEHALTTFDLDLLHGRNLKVRESLQPDPYAWDVLINETGARTIGWSPGTQPVLRHERPGEWRVVGVVRDFHNRSLHQSTLPMVLTPPYIAVKAHSVYARLGRGDLSRTIEAFENVWRKFLPSRPFKYVFLNDHLDAQYRSERVQRKILTFFSVLAIIVSCLGRRRREMGIRKALGADSRTVIYLLSREFLALVVAAFIVATPIAYVFCADWLNTFTYRIDLPLEAFLTGGLLTLGLVALSIAAQTIRASRENPVEGLRTE